MTHKLSAAQSQRGAIVVAAAAAAVAEAAAEMEVAGSTPLTSSAVASVGAVAATTGASLPINPATNFDGDHKEAAEALSALAAEVLSII